MQYAAVLWLLDFGDACLCCLSLTCSLIFVHFPLRLISCYFVVKNNLFEFYFLMHGDWCFCPISLLSFFFGEFSCGYLCSWGWISDLYHGNRSFSSDAVFESNSCYFTNIFEAQVKLSDVFIACGIPASVLSISLFFFCHCCIFLDATPDSCQSVKYLPPLAVKQEPHSPMVRSHSFGGR